MQIKKRDYKSTSKSRTCIIRMEKPNFHSKIHFSQNERLLTNFFDLCDFGAHLIPINISNY